MEKIENNYGQTSYSQMNKIDLEMLCMATIKMVKEFYKNPKNKKAFKKWQAEQERKRAEMLRREENVCGDKFKD